MPVASMTKRFLKVNDQAMVKPRSSTLATSSRMISSIRFKSGHYTGGVRRMVVSIMLSGAGSVAVSARPTFPCT